MHTRFQCRPGPTWPLRDRGDCADCRAQVSRQSPGWLALYLPLSILVADGACLSQQCRGCSRTILLEAQSSAGSRQLGRDKMWQPAVCGRKHGDCVTDACVCLSGQQGGRSKSHCGQSLSPSTTVYAGSLSVSPVPSPTAGKAGKALCLFWTRKVDFRGICVLKSTGIPGQLLTATSRRASVVGPHRGCEQVHAYACVSVWRAVCWTLLVGKHEPVWSPDHRSKHLSFSWLLRHTKEPRLATAAAPRDQCLRLPGATWFRRCCVPVKTPVSRMKVPLWWNLTSRLRVVLLRRLLRLNLVQLYQAAYLVKRQRAAAHSCITKNTGWLGNLLLPSLS